MAVTAEKIVTFTRGVLGDDPNVPKLPVEKYLEAIPRLHSLADVPSGTPVLIRGDVDAKPGAKVGEGDIRLRSMKETLDYARSHGWKSVIFGHIGREPEKSLSKVRTRLAEILGCEVGFIADWLDPATTTIKDEVAQAINSAAPGSVIMLENTRKYEIERVLWKAKPADLPKLVGRLAKLGNEFAQKVAKVYIHEAFSAGSLDASSVVVPAAMDRVALGQYEAEQFDVHLHDCLQAQLVIFSGLKADKLDDMEAMINRGKIRLVISAGSLSASLKRAAAELEGKDFNLGVSEDPAHSDKPYFIPRNRIEQAKQMLTQGRAKGIEFVLPVDFVLQDGQISRQIGPGNQQFERRSRKQQAVLRHGHPLHRGPQERQAAGRRLPQRRVWHVRGPAVRQRHEELRARAEADEGRRDQGLHRRRRRRHVAGTVRQARLGDLCLHRRGHSAQRPGQRTSAVPGGAEAGGAAVNTEGNPKF